MQQYAARLLRKSNSIAPDQLPISIYEYDIRKITRQLEEGRPNEGYLALANQLQEGQARKDLALSINVRTNVAKKM